MFSTEFYIEKVPVGNKQPPFIVAELSGNHRGSLENALNLVEAAKSAGAHAVKIQSYTPDSITLNVKEGNFIISDSKSLWKGRTLYDLYQEAYTPFEWHKPIFDKCKNLGLIGFSTPFDEKAVDFLEELNVPCYKIASLEIVDLPLIRKVASTGKPLMISTGASTLSEIGNAVEAAKSNGCKALILLKCTSTYPALSSDSNLRTIPHLKDCFKTLVGISDHTLGNGAAIASIALGGCVIEKHLTLSRSHGGVDSPFSLEPQEFALLATGAREAWEALGSVHYGVLPSEGTCLNLRPSLFFVDNLKPGTIIEYVHIRSVRPAGGLPPDLIEGVIGLKLTKEVKYGTPVTWNVFK